MLDLKPYKFSYISKKLIEIAEKEPFYLFTQTSNLNARSLFMLKNSLFNSGYHGSDSIKICSLKSGHIKAIFPKSFQRLTSNCIIFMHSDNIEQKDKFFTLLKTFADIVILGGKFEKYLITTERLKYIGFNHITLVFILIFGLCATIQHTYFKNSKRLHKV
jgi:hypothetical protein